MKETEISLWCGNSTYTPLANALNELVPFSGQVEEPRKNRNLEKFRKASNCYHDLYNNGLCNRCSEFTKVFGISGSRVRSRQNCQCGCDAELEKLMEHIIIDAITEQLVRLSTMVKTDEA